MAPWLMGQRDSKIWVGVRLTGHDSLFQPCHDARPVILLVVFRRGRVNFIRSQAREGLDHVVTVVMLDVLIHPIAKHGLR